MSYFCGSCEILFDEAARLPDGSCPECYTKTALEFWPAEPPEGTSKGPDLAFSSTGTYVSNALLPLVPARVPHFPRASQISQFPRTPYLTSNNIQGNPPFTQVDHGFQFFPSPVSRADEEYSQHVRQPSYPQPGPVAPQWRGPQPPLPTGPTGLDGRNGIPIQVPARHLGASSSSDGEDPGLGPRQPFLSPASQGPGATGGSSLVNVNELIKHKISPPEPIMTTLGRTTDEIAEKLSTCININQLLECSENLRPIIEKLRNMKTQCDLKIKEIVERSVSVEEPVDKPSAPVAPEEPLERQPPRQRKKAIPTTIFVRKLSANITEADLHKYFIQFCDKPSEVTNIKIPKDVNKRNKGHAYVALQQGHIVNKVFAQKLHYIKGTLVELLEFDEEEQQRKKKEYKIFVQGLSSFMPEETFEELLVNSYGEVDACWFRPLLNQPTFSNGHAFVSFQEAATNEAILAEGFIILEGRKCFCKQYTQQKSYLEQKKKEGAWYDEKVAPPRDDTTSSMVGSSKAGSPAPFAWSKPRGPVADECKVCLDRTSCMLLKPCNHFGICEQCAEVLNECPFCRTKIESKEKIFKQ